MLVARPPIQGLYPMPCLNHLSPQLIMPPALLLASHRSLTLPVSLARLPVGVTGHISAAKQ